MGSAVDLARLADVKTWLGVASSDDDLLLAQLITHVSRAILDHIGRPSVAPALYTESFDGRNETSVLLGQWPVCDVLSCKIDGAEILLATAMERTGYVVDSTPRGSPGQMQRLSLRGGTFGYGIQNVTITYSAGYRVSGEPAVVPSSAPYEVSVLAPYGDFATDEGVTDASGTSLARVTGIPGAGQYACADGVYAFSSSNAGAPVMLSYGYVPSDLARSCIEWVAERYQYRMRIGQHSKSLGGHESVSFIVKDIPNFVAALLRPYRRVVMP